LGPHIDQILADFVTACAGLTLGAREIRECGAGPTDAMLFTLWRSLNTALGRTLFAKAFETFAPGERKSFASVIDQCAANATRQAEATLVAIDRLQTEKAA
jgi:hypothetical protein